MGDAIVGALVAEFLKAVIAEAKTFKAFKPLLKDLISTMEKLVPLTEDIDSMQNKLNLNVEELKGLEETMKRAQVVVHKCGSVWFLTRTKLAREIQEVNKDMLKFCQINLQLLQYKYQLQSMEASNSNFEILIKKVDGLSDPAPTVSRDLCSVRKVNKVLFGLDLPLINLKEKLLDDDVVSLVVTAPPGCGKTTLVIQLCHDEEIKRKFEHIFYNVVSSAPNFTKLVQDLLLHNGYQPLTTFANDSQMVVALGKLLEKLSEKGPILLVLDDVWRGSESLLHKFQMNLPDYKILVTSRSDFPSFGPTFYLETLKNDDAKALLKKWAPRPLGTTANEYENILQKVPCLNKRSEEILRRCNGFPLVIEVVGGSLKGRSLDFWKGQVESWSKGKTIIKNPDVLDCLQPSFDALESNNKECFLDMGSFLEDQKIRASSIIDIGVDLYGEGSSIMCMKYLEELASQNLLQLVSLGRNEHGGGFYNEFLVTQHDILRELAIHQSEKDEIVERERLNLKITEDKFPVWCSNLRKPFNARLLSISTDESFSSKWINMDFPNVEVLVLHISSSDYALPSFIARMRKIEVLTITNHGFNLAKLRNFSCLSLLPNLKRIRLEKALITLLDIVQLRLNNLEKLSLFMCNFGEVFYDAAAEEIDVSVALPSLQEIDIDYCYDLEEIPYWVPEVVSLKKLSITNSNNLYSLPDAIGDLSKLETLRLSSCINLSELPETIERLCNLRFLDICDCTELRKLPLGIGKLQKLKTISMRQCWRCELPPSVKDLQNLEVKVDEESAYLWKNKKPMMRNLRIKN